GGLTHELLVELMFAVVAVPGVTLAALEGAAREAIIEALVVRLKTAGALGHQPLAGRIEEMVKRLVVQVALGRIAFIGLVHVTENRPFAEKQVHALACRIVPDEPFSQGSAR